MRRISAILAILTGSLLALGEVQANWGDWQWWPWWLVDFVAAAMLVLGGAWSIARKRLGSIVLIAGWAFTAGMVWMSLAGNLADGVDPGRDARMMGSYAMLLAMLLGTSAAGLVLATIGTARHINPTD